MKNLWNFFTKTLKYFLGFLVVYSLIVLWPVRQLFHPSFFTGKQLLIFTNEAEARPCGGFVTAFGTVSFFPLQYELKNSYHFEKNNFGLSEFPLSAVSEKKKFWDLGDTENLGICAKQFQNAYESATGTEIANVILLPIALVEDLETILENPFWEKRKINSDFFATTSRTVANLDRHDEKALSERKKPLVTQGKKIIKKILTQPHKWWKITQMIQEKIRNGAVFSEKISPIIEREPNDFALIEWNLGGGKSSRFLQKNITVNFYEKTPAQWEGLIKLSVRHLGGVDEPISQKWKGVFEIHFPHFLRKRPLFLETEVLPDQNFEKEFTFKNFTLPIESEKTRQPKTPISFFVPRGQKYNLDFTLSIFPQQVIKSQDLNASENTASFFQTLQKFRKTFNFIFERDKEKPFLTLHEVIGFDIPASWIQYFPGFDSKDSEKTHFFAEIHFNEKIKLEDNFGLRITDRDFSLPEISENPIFQDYKLLEDQTTLLLIFNQSIPQIDERFYLEIFEISDLWGNKILPQKRTLITR